MKLIDTNLIIYAAQPQFRWLLPLIGLKKSRSDFESERLYTEGVKLSK